MERPMPKLMGDREAVSPVHAVLLQDSVNLNLACDGKIAPKDDVSAVSRNVALIVQGEAISLAQAVANQLLPIDPLLTSLPAKLGEEKSTHLAIDLPFAE